MTILQAGANNSPEEIGAANGSFFNTSSWSLPGMSELSSGILAAYRHMLPDNRGMLVQFGEDAAGGIIDLDDPTAPNPVKTYSLEFDGSNADVSHFAWRLTTAIPYANRNVQQLYIMAGKLRGVSFMYDGQGVLREKDDWIDTGDLEATIQQIITGDFFGNKVKLLLLRRQEAEENLAKYALGLAAVGLPDYKIERKMEKPTKGVLARGFVACSPIVSSS